jgi:hypothetical protein
MMGSGWYRMPFSCRVRSALNRPVVEFPEDHLAGSGLQDAGHGNVYGPGNLPFGVIYNDHGSIVQVGYALIVFFPFLQDEYSHRFSRQNNGLHRVCQFINIQDLDAVYLGDLVQIEVVRHDAAPVGFRKLDQLEVHVSGVRRIIFDQLNLNMGDFL